MQVRGSFTARGDFQELAQRSGGSLEAHVAGRDAAGVA